jgi:hypothetical protein
MNSHGNSRLSTTPESFLLVTNEWLGFASCDSAGLGFAIGFWPFLLFSDVQKRIESSTRWLIPQGH